MKIEVRADNTVTIEGYVNVTARDSRPICDRDGSTFVEQVEPGTFQAALQENRNVDLKLNHRRRLGSTADVLQLKEDSIGLKAKATVQDEELAQEARAHHLRGWSFGFVAKKQRWEEGDPRRRYLSGIELREVSALTITPAYPATSIEVREDGQELMEYRAEGMMEAEEPDYVVEEVTQTQTTRETKEGDMETEVQRMTAQVGVLKMKRRNRT